MKKKMTDKEHKAIIEQFANEQSVAIGGHIQVTVCEYGGLGMKPRDGYGSMKYEDTEYLRRIIDGAEALLWWFRREGWTITPPKVSRRVN